MSARSVLAAAALLGAVLSFGTPRAGVAGDALPPSEADQAPSTVAGPRSAEQGSLVDAPPAGAGHGSSPDSAGSGDVEDAPKSAARESRKGAGKEEAKDIEKIAAKTGADDPAPQNSPSNPPTEAPKEAPKDAEPAPSDASPAPTKQAEDTPAQPADAQVKSPEAQVKPPDAQVEPANIQGKLSNATPAPTTAPAKKRRKATGPAPAKAVSKSSVKPAAGPELTEASQGRPKPAEAPPAMSGSTTDHVAVPESERVGREMGRTGRVLERARRSLARSKNARAQRFFASALDFQSDASGAYKDHQFARAERLTAAARDYADRATRMVGPPREDPEYVEHVLQRTDDALERADDVLKNGAAVSARNRNEELKRAQKDAWKTLKEGDVEQAYKRTLAVRDGVLVLLRQLENLPVPRAAAEKAISGAQVALEQASKELGPKPNIEATRLVRIANDYLDKARDSFNRKSYRSALLQAKVVERHVEKAVDVGRPRG